MFRWKPWALYTGVAAVAWLGGGALDSGHKAYRHFAKQNPQSTGVSPSISKAGACGAGISFLPVENQSCADQDGEKGENGEKENIRFGMLVHIISPALDVGLGASTDAHIATVRIIHHAESYRSQSLGRTIQIIDRIILREEVGGLLLSRKKVGDDNWEVGFGLSDDTLWTTTQPM